jgi:hypothetical protein
MSSDMLGVAAVSSRDKETAAWNARDANASAHRSRLGMHYVPIPVARRLSEMPNYVSAEEPEASSGAIVEGRDIGRTVVADLGADLDLWADRDA